MTLGRRLAYPSKDSELGGEPGARPGRGAFSSRPSHPRMPDLRQHRRYDLRRRVWCEGERYTVALQTVNASREGVQVRTSIPPPPGTRVHLSLEEPGLGRMVAEAEVVWTRAEGRHGAMGLRLTRFREGHDLWARLLEALERGGRREE